MHLPAVERVKRLGARALGSHETVGLNAPERLGIGGGNGKIRHVGRGVVVIEMLLPLRHGVKHIVRRAQILLARKTVVLPVHHDLARAGVVGGGGAHARKKGAFDRAGKDKRLSFPDAQADLDEKLCVFTKFLLHILLQKWANMHSTFARQGGWIPYREYLTTILRE